MFLNKDTLIRKLTNISIENERHMRKIGIVNDISSQKFLNWNSDTQDTEAPGTNSIINRARKALKNLDLTLSYDDDNLNDDTLNTSYHNDCPQLVLTDTLTHDSVHLQNCKNLSLFLTERRRDRWKSKLAANTFHLHSLSAFNNNPLSNDYAVRQQYPVSDTFFKFAFQSRANLLPTPEFVEIMNNRQHSPCELCLRQNKSRNQSLAHILNGCTAKYQAYTQRHNKVQAAIVKHVRNLHDVDEIYCDRSLHLNELPDNLKRLRPDIVIWLNNRSKCFIIEISVPYACQRDGEDTLSMVYNQKKDKYRDLINHIRGLKIQVQLFVIIVSSLGAVYKDSLTDINHLFLYKSIGKTVIRSVSRAALIGSLKIWFECPHRSSDHMANSSGAPLNCNETLDSVSEDDEDDEPSHENLYTQNL